MRSLVTGATGFLGQYLVRRLLAAGDDVHVLLADEPLPQRQLLPEGITAHDADLRYRDGVRRAIDLAAPDRVFHLAAVGVTDPFLDVQFALRVNLEGTLNLVRAVRGAAPIVVARTPGEDDHRNVYAASKAAAWGFCRMYYHTEGWSITGAMIFSAYGPGQNPRNVIPAALRAARAGEDFPLTPGEQLRDWVYAEDVAAAFIAIAEATGVAGETLHIGTGEGTALKDVIAMLYAAAGSSGKPMPGQLPYRPGEIMTMVADAVRTTALTGWRAEIRLAEGLRRVVAAHTASA